MPEDHELHLTAPGSETVLPAIPPALQADIEQAEALPPAQRLLALSELAAAHPRCLQAWAALAEHTEDRVARYAYARVGYHRGLDALRAAGWKGSGAVRWAHAANRGFLRSLDALRRAAADIGETDEEQRCAHFLRQLDPEWRPGPGPEAGS